VRGGGGEEKDRRITAQSARHSGYRLLSLWGSVGPGAGRGSHNGGKIGKSFGKWPIRKRREERSPALSGGAPPVDMRPGGEDTIVRGGRKARPSHHNRAGL